MSPKSYGNRKNFNPKTKFTMSEINDIVGAEFVQLLTTGKLDAICTAFDHFTDKVISFIHKPIHWAEKHICLARLNAISRVSRPRKVSA